MCSTTGFPAPQSPQWLAESERIKTKFSTTGAPVINGQ